MSRYLVKLKNEKLVNLFQKSEHQGYISYNDLCILSNQENICLEELKQYLRSKSIQILYEDKQLSSHERIKSQSDSSPHTTVRDSSDTISVYFSEISHINLLSTTQELELARVIQEGLSARKYLEYLKDKRETISSEKRQKLEKLITEGLIARNQFIEANLRLVISVAKHYQNRGLALEDLIQEGNLGLIKAVDRFDPTRGVKFSTYAVNWIKQNISRAINNKGRTIRLPEHINNIISQMSRVEAALSIKLGRKPTLIELASELEMDVERVAELQRIALHPLSLETLIGDEENSILGDIIHDNNSATPLQYTFKELEKDNLLQALNKLTPREATILKMRAGFINNHVYTLQEVGEELGLTRERIRQIELKAKRKLKMILSELGIKQDKA